MGCQHAESYYRGINNKWQDTNLWRRNEVFPQSMTNRRQGGRLSIKKPSHRYKDPHVKDKTVSRPSYLWHGNPIPGKDGIDFETGPRSLINRIMCINTRSTMIFFETSSTDLNDIIGIWLLQNDKNTNKITENMSEFCLPTAQKICRHNFRILYRIWPALDGLILRICCHIPEVICNLMPCQTCGSIY